MSGEIPSHRCHFAIVGWRAGWRRGVATAACGTTAYGGHVDQNRVALTPRGHRPGFDPSVNCSRRNAGCLCGFGYRQELGTICSSFGHWDLASLSMEERPLGFSGCSPRVSSARSIRACSSRSSSSARTRSERANERRSRIAAIRQDAEQYLTRRFGAPERVSRSRPPQRPQDGCTPFPDSSVWGKPTESCGTISSAILKAASIPIPATQPARSNRSGLHAEDALSLPPLRTPAQWPAVAIRHGPTDWFQGIERGRSMFVPGPRICRLEESAWG